VKDTTTGLNNQFAVTGTVPNGPSVQEELYRAALENVSVQVPEMGPRGDQTVEKDVTNGGNLSDESINWLNSSCDLPNGISLSQLTLSHSNVITIVSTVTLRIEKPGDCDPEIDHIDEILDLQYFTKSYSDGFYYALNLAEMLKKGGWWGLVGVELNPGPPKAKKSASKKQAKVREVVKFVEKEKGTRKSSKGSGSTGRNFGSKIGGFLGDAAQKALMAITGMGDYTVKSNSLYEGAIRSNSPPQFAGGKDGNGNVMPRRREYLADVVSIGANFNATTFVINPENPATFPWLSAMALLYEQYRIHGMVFEFKSTSATAIGTTNTALGSVMLATQYNVLEKPFISKLQMDQYEFAVATNPSISCIHPIECDPQKGAPEYLFTNTSSLSQGGDPRLSNFANFTIATEGQQSGAKIGELWISYEIEFAKPRLDTGIVSFAQDFEVHLTSSPVGTPWTMSTTNMFANPAGAVWDKGNLSELPITFGTTASGYANQILFPANITGTFRFTFFLCMSSLITKTAAQQKIFRMSVTQPQPWISASNALVAQDSVNHPGTYFGPDRITLVTTACTDFNACEEYVWKIGANTQGSIFTINPNFAFDATLKFISLSVIVSPIWYTNG
jgi:hypothetical protein